MMDDDEDNNVDVMDVLGAMAESLVETQAIFLVPDQPDKLVKPVLGGKPPREIFYRNTDTFTSKLPPSVQARRCTCKYLCTGAAATIKCLSCAIYDPWKVGYYCQLCFDARHPWYRIPHVFANIESDESIEYTIKVANQRTETKRFEMEGQSLLKKVRDRLPELAIVGDDEHVDNRLRLAGRRTTSLEDHLRGLRRQLRGDIAKSGGEHLLQMSDEEATMAITRWLRGHAVRRMISKSLVLRYVRVWDATLGKEFYFDQSTKQSSWVKPMLLMAEDIDKLEYVEDPSVKLKWACKQFKATLAQQQSINSKSSPSKNRTPSSSNNSNSTNTPKRTRRKPPPTPETVERSALVLCGFFRCVKARKRVVSRANEIYRRVLWESVDETAYSSAGHGACYYANIMTGHTSWTKPAVYLTGEPPLIVPSQFNDVGDENDTHNQISSNNYNNNNIDTDTDNNHKREIADSDESSPRGGSKNSGLRRVSPRTNRIL